MLWAPSARLRGGSRAPRHAMACARTRQIAAAGHGTSSRQQVTTAGHGSSFAAAAPAQQEAGPALWAGRLRRPSKVTAAGHGRSRSQQQVTAAARPSALAPIPAASGRDVTSRPDVPDVRQHSKARAGSRRGPVAPKPRLAPKARNPCLRRNPPLRLFRGQPPEALACAPGSAPDRGGRPSGRGERENGRESAERGWGDFMGRGPAGPSRNSGGSPPEANRPDPWARRP